jgi:vacuolar protein sorting-associated protein 35
MQRALDSNKLMDALKHASNMLEELRTGLLGPKAYFDLYGITSEYLRYLEVYLSEDKHGKAMNELYELVQYAGNILQRLYLLITVGSVYIKLKKAPAKEVLKDLVEMCRGVQHPTRGLFLRTYLAEMTKDKLPELNSPYAEAGGGDILDCVDFILINFTEMNKLWVRMQHQGTSRDRAKRERERKQLSILVGKNLSLLSGLEGVDVKLYKEAILPKVLDQIVSCKDSIAQQDLLDILIQVISDDWHLRTLKPLMKMFVQLEPEVDVKQIIVSLLERLGNYIMSPEGGVSMTTNSAVPVAKELIFPTFFQYITRMIERRRGMPTEHALAMLAALADLAYKCYQGSEEYVNKVYDFAVVRCVDLAPEQQTKPVIDQLFKLLRIPLEQVKNPLRVLDIKSYVKLALECLIVTKRRRIALDIAKKIMDTGTVVPDTETAEKLFVFLRILIADPILSETDYYDTDELAHEQNLLSALIHRMKSSDIEQQYGMIILAKKNLAGEAVEGQQPVPASRQRYTLPALSFALMNLVKFIYKNRETTEAWDKKVRLCLKFCYTHMSSLYDRESSVFFFKLYLQYAQAAAYSGLVPSAKEAVERALEIYDDDISSAAFQFEVLRVAMSTLRALYPHFATAQLTDDWQSLATNVVKFGANLIKKADRCRALSMASHLFFIIDESLAENKLQDGPSITKCLTNAGKTAESQENDVDLNLFVDLLNEYLYYISAYPEVARRCSGIISHLASQLSQASQDDSTEQGRRTAFAAGYFKNTLKHIAASKSRGESKYAEIALAESS